MSNNFIESRRSQDVPFAVSTDVAGVYGDPALAEKFWERVLGKKTNFDLELISWKWLDKPEANPALSIAGFHGRMGLEKMDISELPDMLKITALNSLIFSTPKLLKKANSSQYVLIHEPEARQQARKIQKFFSQSENGPTLAIENHPTPGSVQRTLGLIKSFNEKKIAAVAVFDIVHSIRAADPGLSYEEKWDAMLAEMELVEQCIVHLPIGTLSFDSINFKEVTPVMMRALAGVIKKYDSVITIEHQIGNIKQQINPYPAPEKQAPLVDRARIIVKALTLDNVLDIRS